VLTTAQNNARHLRDLGKTAFTNQVVEKSRTKSKEQPQILPSAPNYLLIYHDPLVPTFITADGFNHFLVRRHDDRLEEILPRVVGL
jgi:hypothetical protein